jgi:hypothetical protein
MKKDVIDNYFGINTIYLEPKLWIYMELEIKVHLLGDEIFDKTKD